MTPLYVATKTGLERACQHLFLKGSDVDAPEGYCGTPLQVAALQGHDTIVRLLLEKGADVNAHG
jgi:ankyrin repeat protein